MMLAFVKFSILYLAGALNSGSEGLQMLAYFLSVGSKGATEFLLKIHMPP